MLNSKKRAHFKHFQYSFFLRAVSLSLVATFLLQDFSWAAAELVPKVIDLFGKPKVTWSLPESVGTIEDAWNAPQGDKQIILLQDAHTNESGQLNLAKIIEMLLTQEKGLRYVFTEAAVGDNSLDFLRPYRPLAERKTLARAYLRRGLLHGTEYLHLTSDADFILWGVENPEFYIRSLEDYKQVARERERFDVYLKKIHATLSVLKARLFNPALFQFDGDMEKYQKEEISLTDYFNVLMRASALLNMPLSDFPHLKDLRDLKEKEAGIDFRKANEEQLQAVKSLSPSDQEELKELTESEKKAPSKLTIADPKGERTFYALLEQKVKRSGHEELFKYFDYLKTAKRIETKDVFLEVKALETRVLQFYAVSEDEKMLIRCGQLSRHLEKLFHMNLTPEEFKEYKEFNEVSSKSLHSLYSLKSFLHENRCRHSRLQRSLAHCCCRRSGPAVCRQRYRRG